MSRKTKVFLIGGTGETGREIVNGLVEGAEFELTIFTRAQSASSDAISEIEKRGLKVVTAPANATAEDLVPLLRGIDVVVSAIAPSSQQEQTKWIDAALEAKVKRFVPCGFITICPRGVMILRDDKEDVHDYMFRLRLPFTIIDVGYWYQLSFPSLPSGRVDYAVPWPSHEICHDGMAPNLLIHKPDIGKYVALIVKDPRTLNKRVIAYGAELSQNEISDKLTKASGEKLELVTTSASELTEAHGKGVDNWRKERNSATTLMMYISSYKYSKYVRGDNTLDNARYLGYLDAHELYPNFNPLSFDHFVQELLDGKVQKPYA